MAGNSCHPDCPRATVPPGLPPMTVDDAFVVVDPKAFTVTAKDFTDGVAGFRIESPTDTTLAILVVLGYDASDQIRWSWTAHSVAIPDADSEYWQIHLDPTTSIGLLSLPPPPGTERHAMWPDPAGHTSCLLLEHWGSEPLPSRELIAPKTDTDCDGVAAANECAPWIPNATGIAPTIADASCVVPTILAGGGYSCQVGGPQCTEVPTGPRENCVTLDQPYCVPQVLCQCSSMADPQPCLDSTARMGIVGGTIPYLKCVIRVDTSFNRCDSNQLQVDAGPLLGGSSRTCKALRLSDGGRPFAQFDDRLHVGDAKLRFDNFSQPCKVDASWENGMAPLENYGVLDAVIDNGYHLVVPVKVELRPGCDVAGASGCSLFRPTTSETLYNCLAADSTGIACAPDPNTGCPGPMCNDTCCSRGEHCTPNGCACGPDDIACPTGDICAPGGGGSNTDSCGTICCGTSGPCPLAP